MISIYSYVDKYTPFLLPFMNAEKRQTLTEQCQSQGTDPQSFSRKCGQILSDVTDASRMYFKSAQCINQYDIRLTAPDCGSLTWPSGVKYLAELMNVCVNLVELQFIYCDD
jgi:hypothetical protein